MQKKNKKGPRSVSRTVSMIVKIVATILVIAIVTSAICATVFALYIDRYIRPNIDNINMDDIKLNYTTFVYATDNETGEKIELEQLYSEDNRIWVDYEQIPNYMLDAVVSVEDNRFWNHAGVDWIRTAGAMVNMIIPLREGFGGGSTLTQQLIKNVTGEDDITVERKIQEILRALEFEKKYTKEQIIELYLNTVYFGHGCNGVETAAKTYFDKTVSELTLAECATIAGITKSPIFYDPLKNPENNKTRQELILKLMYDQGRISKEEYTSAVAEELQFNKNSSAVIKEKPMQSYYVDQVINDVINDLQEEYGYSYTYASNLVFSGGLKIYALVDTDVQDTLDKVYKDEANFPKTKDGSMLESAMVVMDPYTGNVLGMVGGRGEKTTNRAWNRATMTKRPPGSSIKPLTVYAPALEYGFINPATVYDDSPFNEKTRWPKNQSSGFSGRMTVKKAVQNSTNTVAVKVLDTVSLERSFAFASVNLGLDLVKSETINDKVFTDMDYAPLALGGLTHGLSVLEMTAAYSAFVNHGIFTEPRTYSHVEDADGNILLDNKAETQVAMKEETAYYINYLLTNAVDAGTGRKAKLGNVATAGKTGTTNDDNDRWFVGYTPYYTAAVWFGYDNSREIKLSTSTNPSVAIWKTVMDELHDGLEYKNFFQLETKQTKYCLDSGLLPSEYCELDPRGNRVTTGTFIEGTEPTETCTCHVPVIIDTTTNMRATNFCPYENTKTIALIDVNRTGNIQMTDDPYLYHDAVYSTTENTESVNYNTYCSTHSYYIPENPLDNPTTPIEPSNPSDPTIPTEPTVPTDPPEVDPTPPSDPINDGFYIPE